ncbi:hypothetical protein [Actinokineospora enzanensis]|uniref:hypothetical protein n=1 Tax=Actinokineospora enzanensis TaxID=155975 RepID=UPI0003680DC8|nr:hypothetical protein [Actinokineospora enzanensis]
MGRTRRFEHAVRMGLAVLMVVTGVTIALPSASVAEAPSTSATPSAVTVRGTGSFSALSLTVSQTRDLINQTVHVSWSGAAPTDQLRSRNYLQIMQCWGDDPTGPKREQCQYGSPLGNYDSAAMWSRALLYSDLMRDPNEKQPQQTDIPGGTTYVPFTPVSGAPTKPSERGDGLYFDANSTNEIQLAATRDDGTGDVDFEVQTTLEASGLDCGRPYVSGADTGKPRHCWLVVVPRGDTETNGKKLGTDPGSYFHTYLDSSPLSTTNWANRVMVRLDFKPVGEQCALGRAERPLNVDEFIADAVQRWQPALCAGNGPVFGYVQMADREARRQLATSDPGLVFVSKPAAPEELLPTQPAVYAPVSVSAYTLAFIMERQPAPGSPPDVMARNGQPITELNLTPRLVAKLLSQSYSDAVPGPQDYLAGNPTRLSNDPEFLRYNPEFKVDGFLMQTVDALASSIDMDGTSTLWAWLNGDREARDFLDGKPDEWGMKVNRYFQGVGLPVENFPKADTTCVDMKFNGVIAPMCTITRHPLAADMHEAGRSVNRGDSLGREPNGQRDPLDPSRPAFQKVGRSVIGRRAMVAVVDTVTAARYGLYTAKLRNAAGNFVAPTTDNIMAGVAAMTPSKVAGVKMVNPAATAPNAYPMPMVTYAATTPSALSVDAGKDYATLLRYAAGDGQVLGEGVGQLPAGFVPLPQDMRDAAKSTATVIERDAGKKVALPETGGDGSGGGSDTPGDAVTGNGDAATGGSSGDSSTGGTGGGDTAPAAAQPPTAGAKPSADAAADTSKPAAATRTTPGSPVSWFLRYLLVALLVAGGLAAGGGPLLSRFGAARRK